MDPVNELINSTGWRYLKKKKSLFLAFMLKWKSSESCLAFLCDIEIEKHLDELVMRVSTCEVDQPYKILTFQHSEYKRLGCSGILHKLQSGRPLSPGKKNAPVTSFTQFHYH